MDDEHTAHLQRILANRKKRGASVQRAPSPSRSMSVADSQQSARFADGVIGSASPVAAPPAAVATGTQGVQVDRTTPTLPQYAEASPPPSSKRRSPTAGHDDAPPPPSAQPPSNAFVSQPLPPPMSAPPMAAPPMAAPPMANPPLRQHRGSASTSNSSFAAIPQVGAPSQAGGASALFAKGIFSNFRHNPVLVSPNVRPYRSSSAGPAQVRPTSPLATSPNRGAQTSPGRGGAAGTKSPNRGGSPGRSLAKGKLMATFAEPVTARNPFRHQTFEEFSLNPRHGPPSDFVPLSALADQLVTKRLPTAPVRQSTVGVEHVRPKAAPTAGSRPLFNLAECVQVLSRGDWFLKWTRKGQVHKRYFWLDASRGCLVWGKHPDSSILLTSSLRLAEVVSMQAQCVVEDETNRTYYKMHIVTQDRFLHVATEKRDKFDVWFDSIQRLSDNLKRTVHFPRDRMTETPFKPDRHPDTGLVQLGTSDD